MHSALAPHNDNNFEYNAMLSNVKNLLRVARFLGACVVICYSLLPPAAAGCMTWMALTMVRACFWHWTRFCYSLFNLSVQDLIIGQVKIGMYVFNEAQKHSELEYS